MEDEILAENGKLNFCIRTDFDVDALFGTNVATAENDDYLNVYADYDMSTRQVCEDLEIVLVRDDTPSESLAYRMDTAEQQYIRAKMDDYCQKQEGMTLDALCDHLVREANSLQYIRPMAFGRCQTRMALFCKAAEGSCRNGWTASMTC